MPFLAGGVPSRTLDTRGSYREGQLCLQLYWFRRWEGASAQGTEGKFCPCAEVTGRAGEVTAATHWERAEEEEPAVIVVADITEFFPLCRCGSQLFPCVFLLKTHNGSMKWFQ